MTFSELELGNVETTSVHGLDDCSLAAAFRAADAEDQISMRHLVQAVATEYAKQGSVDA